jgi:hypothetical protein
MVLIKVLWRRLEARRGVVRMWLSRFGMAALAALRMAPRLFGWLRDRRRQRIPSLRYSCEARRLSVVRRPAAGGLPARGSGCRIPCFGWFGVGLTDRWAN